MIDRALLMRNLTLLSHWCSRELASWRCVMDHDQDDWLDESSDTAADSSVGVKQQVEPPLQQLDVKLPEDDGLSLYEARATEERFRNIGYLEAFDQAKEVKLQEGFEEGYRRSFEAAMTVGEILGETATAEKVARTTNDEIPQSTHDNSEVLPLEEKRSNAAKLVYDFLVKDVKDVDLEESCHSSDITDLKRRLEDLAVDR